MAFDRHQTVQHRRERPGMNVSLAIVREFYAVEVGSDDVVNGQAVDDAHEPTQVVWQLIDQRSMVPVEVMNPDSA